MNTGVIIRFTSTEVSHSQADATYLHPLEPMEILMQVLRDGSFPLALVTGILTRAVIWRNIPIYLVSPNTWLRKAHMGGHMCDYST
jgi:hypothetical protein